MLPACLPGTDRGNSNTVPCKSKLAGCRELGRGHSREPGPICFSVSAGRREHMLPSFLCRDRPCCLVGTACTFGGIRGSVS